ncbi:methyltransferase family protein [Halodesulfurarchaeum sp.]|uniref:methyltransferase family protein n=1 Tax=Halodesulfurarchaeum sp. TaxID=1980530 RepID=UPI003FA5E002
MPACGRSSGRKHLAEARAADRLCTTGPYRYVRHPLYAAWLWLVLSGMTFLMWLWPLFGAVPVMYALTRLSLPIEAATLQANTGPLTSATLPVPALWPRPTRKWDPE